MKLFQKLLNEFHKFILTDIHFIHHANNKTKLLYLFIFLFVVFAITLQLLFLNRIYNIYVSIISISALLSCFFIMISNLHKSEKLQYLHQDFEEIKLYNKSLKISNDDVSAFKHDFSNIIQAIGGYITINDMDGLKIYYSQLFHDCQKLNNLYTLNPEVINNPAIYSILSSKYHKADSLGITIHLNVFLNLKELNMKIYEFARILGILLDNALEAASECVDKIIIVEIRKDMIRNRQLLIIENTYSEKDIDIERIFQKGFSSKTHNTGIGLWEVRQILKKNNNLNLHTSKDNRFFKQQLEIYPKLDRTNKYSNKEYGLVKIHQ